VKVAFLIIITLGFGLMGTGCATATHQTEALLSSPSHLPLTAEVKGVPFVQQSLGHCGPATLTMALQFYGKALSVEQVAAQVYTPGVQGSFQADMISASRRQGMLAIPIEGMQTVFSEVAAGHPVIVFENLALSWLPQWHYAVLYGYDLSTPKVMMHSGPEAAKQWDLRKFERSWMLADYWGLLVLPPGELSVTADELAHVKATVALENIGKFAEAKKSYESILARWPESLGAAIGSANIAYAEAKPAAAAKFLEQATKNHPHSAIAWHNLAIAYGAEKKETKARRSALEALRWASAEEKTVFSKNLQDWL
jgi:tetratricopeptide (TPR) repeat protein